MSILYEKKFLVFPPLLNPFLFDEDIGKIKNSIYLQNTATKEIYLIPKLYFKHFITSILKIKTSFYSLDSQSQLFLIRSSLLDCNKIFEIYTKDEKPIFQVIQKGVIGTHKIFEVISIKQITENQYKKQYLHTTITPNRRNKYNEEAFFYTIIILIVSFLLAAALGVFNY